MVGVVRVVRVAPTISASTGVGGVGGVRQGGWRWRVEGGRMRAARE